MVALYSRETSSLCPGTLQGTEVSGCQIYCGSVVDPDDAADTILPAKADVATFEGCLDLCKKIKECTGLSYIEASTTCYLHKGSHKPAVKRDGWNGAMKVKTLGAPTSVSGSGSTSSTATATVTASSITSSTPSTSISPSTTASAAQKTTSPSPNHSTSSALSSGATAGIVLGVLALLAFAFLLGFFKLRKGQRRHSSDTRTLPFCVKSSKSSPSWIPAFLRKKQPRPMSKLRAQLLADRREERNDFEEIKIDHSVGRSELP